MNFFLFCFRLKSESSKQMYSREEPNVSICLLLKLLKYDLKIMTSEFMTSKIFFNPSKELDILCANLFTLISFYRLISRQRHPAAFRASRKKSRKGFKINCRNIVSIYILICLSQSDGEFCMNTPLHMRHGEIIIYFLISNISLNILSF
jgi:hypothetical protein